MNNVMFYYERKIFEYVCETENQVLYRVTPYYKEGNKRDKLVYGVQMEAMFINESGNEDINSSFNVFVYNKQPFIEFNYETGKDLSYKMSDMECNYVIDKKKRKFHLKCCASVRCMNEKRMRKFRGKREDLINGNNIEFKCRPCEICDSGVK